METNKTLAELTEFYSVTDLIKFRDSVERLGLDGDEAIEFLRTATVKDYADNPDVKPRIVNYYTLYLYKSML